MKTIKKLVLLLLLIAMATVKVSAKEAFAVIFTDWEDYRIEFFYEESHLAYNNPGMGEYSFLLNSGTEDPGWYADPDMLPYLMSIKKAIFHLSFEEVPITSTRKWFRSMENLTTVEGIVHLNTSQVTTMKGMFAGCKRLTSLDLSSFNVANVTDMSEMFSGCESLTSLDLSVFNVSKVTDMSDMFESCSHLTSLNLSGWNTAVLTNVDGIFDGCNFLTTLNVSGWTNPMLTNMSGMFANLIGLTNLNLTNFNTSAATNMSSMFLGCINLPSLDLRGFNVANVTDMSFMFQYCSSLTSINLSGWNASKVTDMSSMFQNCSSLTNINVSGWTNTIPNNMSSMFKGCSALVGIDLTNFNTSAVISMHGLFSGCSNLTQITYGNNWDTSNVTDMSNMFENCSAFTNLNLLSFSNNTGNVTNMSGMFKGCSNLTGFAYGSSLNTINVTDMSEMFCGCSSLTNISNIGAGSWNVSKVTNMYSMFSNCSSLTSLVLNWYTNSLTNMGYMFSGCSKLTSITYGSNWNTSKVTNMSCLYLGCSSLANGNLTSLNTSSVTNMSGMFSGCSAMTGLDVSGWNTSNVTKMGNMFQNCILLTDIDGIGKWNTRNVYYMSYMFSGCSNLVTLTLTGWDTSQVIDMEGIFEGCGQLTTIYVGNGWTAENVSIYDTLFGNCTSLVGGNGTRWDSSHIDRTYARIDASGSPGYLTEMSVESYAVYNNTTLTFYCDQLRTLRTGTSYDLPTGSNAPGWSESSVAGNITSVAFDPSFANARPQSTYRWFHDMGSLTSISGVENLNTSQVTVMSEMFYGCSQLGASLNLTGFNTSNVTAMSAMFRGCSALSNLDLTNWDTRSVTNMSSMFRECSILEAIYVGSTWSTQAVTNSSNMFTNSTQLVGGNGTHYNATHVDASYAHIDKSASPGYLRDHLQEHNVQLVLLAGMCNKSVEVWKGDGLLGSISTEGGSFIHNFENIGYYETLQLRVPNQYLKTITVNGEDVTTSLESTTPDDPDYEGYTFYSLGNLSETSIVEVKYSYVPLATSSILFDFYGLNAAGTIKDTKIYFEDGTTYTDNVGRLNINWSGRKIISKIEVTMVPAFEDFAYAQQNNVLGTIVDNGDGTYFYTIYGENLTNFIIPLWFPTSNFGSVKTNISSKNDFVLGYYFGEYVNAEGGFLPNYDQSNSSFTNTDVTVMHYPNWSDAEWGGYSAGVIYIHVPQGTSFRLIENGTDHTADCEWHNANETFFAFDRQGMWRCPVDGYYYLLQDVEHDSYIIVDDGTTPLSEIESPFQVVQTIAAYGDATLSLRKSNGDVVKSVSNGESGTASWDKGTNMQLVVTLPANASAANYEAHLIIDGIDNILTTMTGDGGVLTFKAYDMENVTSSHNIALITRQTGGVVSAGITQSLLVTGEQVGKAHVFMLDDEGIAIGDFETAASEPFITIWDSWEDFWKDVVAERISVSNVPEGYTVKVYFNGNEIETTINENGNYNAILDGATAVKDGTWLVSFIKEGEDDGTTLTVTMMDAFDRVYLIDKDGKETECFGSWNVVDWPEGESLTVEATNLVSYPYNEASLIVDGTVVPLVYDAEKNRFTGYELSEVNSSHNIVLQMKRVKSFFTAFAGAENRVAIAEIDEEGNVIVNGGGSPESISLSVASTSGVKLTFTPAKGNVLTELTMDGWSVPLTDENLSQTANGDYVFILPAYTFSASDHHVYAIFSHLEGDLNGDGEINVSDVTALVNKILHP